MDSLVERLKSDPCHILVFTLGSLAVTLEDFVRGILLVAPEIRFVPVVNPADLASVLAYREFNFSPPVRLDEAMTPNLNWTIDGVCKTLYLTYQNEQILETSEQMAIEKKQLQTELQLKSLAPAGLNVQSLMEEIQVYDGLTSKPDLIIGFLSHLSKKLLQNNISFKSIYFKYMPTVQSFVVLHAMGHNESALQGLGGKLSPDEIKDLSAIFRLGKIPEQIQLLLEQGLKVNDFQSQPLFLSGILDGFFVFWSDTTRLESTGFSTQFLIFKMVLEKVHLQRQIQGMDVPDPLTNLLGKVSFHQSLKEEISRARRLQKGVSVVRIAVDELEKIEAQWGAAARDQALQILATLTVNTSRTNDRVFRTGSNEVSVVLPHTGRKGATLKAERLRRWTEKSFYQSAGQAWTVSCGVAEYPSHCSSAEDLENCSLGALEHVRGKSTNKVCLFQAPAEFKPEFEAPSI